MALKKLKKRRRTEGSNSNLIPILYVEDHDLNWMVMDRVLRGEYELVRAKNAEEVFAQLRSERFRIILMDIQLRGSQLDGLQITSVLKGKETGPVPPYALDISHNIAAIPVVFVTAYTSYKRDELLAAGGDDVLHKPVDTQKLREILTRLLTN